MNIKKVTSLFFIYSLFCIIYAQSQENETAKENEQVIKEPSSFGFYFGSEFITSTLRVRTHDNEIPSPPFGESLNVGILYNYNILKYMNIAPSLDFALFHYGIYKGKAYICEIENRTALTLSFLLDVPLMAVFKLKSWTLSGGGGIGFFIRAGVLEPGIKPNDTVPDSLPAQAEVKLINSYFWKNGRFIYPSLGIKAEYTFDTGWKCGLNFKTFMPLFNLFDKAKPDLGDSFIIQLMVVLHPPKIRARNKK